MNWKLSCCTVGLLVTLRLALGWHLFFEGVKKYHDDKWSSEVYLREAHGPLAPYFRDIAGDPLAERLTYREIPQSVDRASLENAKYMPERLEGEWDLWFDTFVETYRLDGDQLAEAKDKLHKRKHQLVHWLLNAKITIDKPSDLGPSASREMSIEDWIEYYEKLEADARSLTANELRQAQHELRKNEVSGWIKDKKDDARRIRAALAGALKAQDDDMRKIVRGVLTLEQHDKKMPDVIKPGLTQRDLLGWIDFLVPLGLVIAGGLLMLGFLTRTACVFGALLVLSFYLAMIPTPRAPDLVKNEGQLIVNKNLIEVLALLTLATLPTGRWAGLDGVFGYLFRRRVPARAQPAATPPPARELIPTVEAVRPAGRFT